MDGVGRLTVSSRSTRFFVLTMQFISLCFFRSVDSEAEIQWYCFPWPLLNLIDNDRDISKHMSCLVRFVQRNIDFLCLPQNTKHKAAEFATSNSMPYSTAWLWSAHVTTKSLLFTAPNGLRLSSGILKVNPLEGTKEDQPFDYRCPESRVEKEEK